MSDFVQTMKDWHRMCKAMTDRNPKDACNGCPLEAYGCSPVYDAFDSYQDVDFDTVGEHIAAWATEHPEPVYPTWYEYLREGKIIPDVLEDCGDYYKTIGKWLVKANIPADIAQKMGIEPKEGV